MSLKDAVESLIVDVARTWWKVSESATISEIYPARGFGGRHAPTRSPRQRKEVIPVAHINVGSVASLGAMAGGERHRTRGTRQAAKW